MCGQFVCTGLNNVLITDEDGSLSKIGLPTAIIPLNSGIASTIICHPSAEMNAYFCWYIAESRYASLVFESLDTDSFSRTISPIILTSIEEEDEGWTVHAGGENSVNPDFDYETAYATGNAPDSGVGAVYIPENNVTYEGQFFNVLNSFRNYDRTYSVGQNLRMSRFVSLAQLNRSYNIQYTGTLPTEMRYQLQEAGATDGVILTVPYVRPNSVLVYKNGVKQGARTGRPDITTDVEMSDPSGTHRWIYDTNTIVFKIDGSDIIELRIVDSIQLTMRLDMTPEEFFADDGETEFIDRLAAALGIPSYRIRVVDSYRGSTVLVLFIDQDADLAAEGSSTDVKEELSVIE